MGPSLRLKLAAVLAASCSVVLGSSACFFSLEDVASDAGSSADGGSFDATNGDAPTFPEGGGNDVVPSCVPSGPESCTNGKDDDCNGKTDCDDPACGSFQCAPAAPAGWTPLFLSPASPAACPAPLDPDAGRPVALVPPGAATACTCTCAPQGGSCANATLSIYAGNGGSCPAAPSVTNAVTNTNCVDLATALNATSSLRLDASAPPTSCAPQLGSPPPPSNGEECTLAGAPSSACRVADGGTGTCMQRATSPFTRCIASNALDAGACPAGYPNRYTSGDTAADTRTCAGCNCATAPCVTSVEIYKQTGCVGAPDVTASPDGTCQNVGNLNIRAYKTLGLSATGCNVTAPATTTGELTFAGGHVVCCL